MIISEEFREKLIEAGIVPENVVKFTTENDKKTRKNITTITLIDGTVHKLIDDFIYYASIKNKKW
ncbi:hypothetical protein [Trichloromonas sp.]|uniref:hypothetical protein n=1 Tax=Trichloromonas sp. TaxID=3069249 RepID=UPI002A4E02B4|nr:hypothetical protein [Trichloromonas sp.]